MMVVAHRARNGAFLRSLIVLLASVIAVAVTARMGLWQLDRAAQKTALQALIDERTRRPELPASALARSVDDAQAQHHRAVRLQGQWLLERTVFLDNRQMDGRPGFIVVTPLKLAGANDAVLVQRGWVPRDRTRSCRVATRAAAGRRRGARAHCAAPGAALRIHRR